jgi:serine/threonine-protein kinase
MARLCPVCDLTYDDAQAFCARCGTALRADGTTGLVGTVIGERYLVTGLLGEGGMGRVYRARHVRLPKDVAIKVLDGRLLRDAASLRRFTDEATRQSRVRNPHVVAVEDFGETADHEPYLVMELVEGPTLRDALAGGPLAPARAVALVRQLASGLEAIHALPIVHRDLKPENVMLARGAEGEEIAKLLDFGIGKAIDDSDRGRTQTGMVIGTPAYMSPEQVAAEPLDARSDVYALALVAYELLTGRLPFSGGSAHELMFSRLSTDPVPVTVARTAVGVPPLPPAVDLVFAAALARDREQRTPSARAFAVALAEAVAATGTPVAPAGVPEAAPDAIAGPAGGPTRTTTSPPGRPDATAGPSPVAVGASGRGIAPALIGGGLVLVAALGWAVVRLGGGSAPQPSTDIAAPAVTAAPTVRADSDAAASVSATPAPDPASSAPPAASRTAPPASGPGSAARAAASPADAQRELEAIGRVALDTADAIARSPEVLDRTARLLPRLRTADDSAEAWLYRGIAFQAQQNRVEGCRAFGRARPTAARPNLVSVLELNRNMFECP